MSRIFSKQTVYFEDPFWVGIFERDDGKNFESAKVVFGAEPKDYEVYAFFLENYSRLRFSPPVASAGTEQKKTGFKRMLRAAQKALDEKGIGTKAQQALKLQHEQAAKIGKKESRLKSEQEQKRRLELNNLKKKEKHKGH